jgi:hypothetical protein
VRGGALLVLLGAGALAAWRFFPGLHAHGRFLEWLIGLMYCLCDESPGAFPFPGQTLLFAAVGVAAGLTLLLPFALAVCCRLLRVPLSRGLFRGYRGLAVPTAAVLMLIYAGVVLVTAHDETRLNRVLDDVSRHEGRTLARLLGRAWPEAAQPQRVGDDRDG